VSSLSISMGVKSARGSGSAIASTDWKCFPQPRRAGESTEVRTLFSSCSRGRRNATLMLDGLWANLFALSTCSLVAVAVSGCGSASGGSATNTVSGGTSTVASASLSTISCINASLTGAGTDACTVTLSTAAGSGGLSVGLTSGNAVVTVPASVTVPANATSAGFTTTVSAVATAQAVTLTASVGGVSKTFAIQLNNSVANVAALNISTASVAFGNVTVNTTSTLPVIITSTGTATVTINSAIVSGTGFTMSGATFPVILNPNLALTLDLNFDPQTAGAVTGQLTVDSNASTNSTVAVGLSGTGVSASGSGSHQVTLIWDAPSSSSDPVVGYDIYRATGGSSTYELLNSLAGTQTTYVDTNVQANATYVYYVTSVDSSRVQSPSSNLVTATIP
jgi:hypothetical protein